MSSAGTSSQSTGDETSAVARQLAEARAELAAMHGLQASFAHGVSRHLRAPLRALDSFSALLATHLGGGLDDTSRDYIARIRGATARLRSEERRVGEECGRTCKYRWSQYH